MTKVVGRSARSAVAIQAPGEVRHEPMVESRRRLGTWTAYSTSSGMLSVRARRPLGDLLGRYADVRLPQEHFQPLTRPVQHATRLWPEIRTRKSVVEASPVVGDRRRGAWACCSKW